MANVVLELEQKRLIGPPKWLGGNVHYLTIMGSVAYGVSADTSCHPRHPRPSIQYLQPPSQRADEQPEVAG